MADTQSWKQLQVLLDTQGPTVLDEVRRIDADEEDYYSIATLNGSGDAVVDCGYPSDGTTQTWGQLLNILNSLSNDDLNCTRTIDIEETTYDSVACLESHGGPVEVRDKGRRPTS